MTNVPLDVHFETSPAVQLLSDLGYALDPVPIDVEAWKAAGFALPIDERESIFHLGSVDEVEMLALRTEDDAAPFRILATYREFNRILRPLVIREREDGSLELWGWTSAGSIGRLEIPRHHLPDETARRLDLIGSRAGHDLGSRLEVALDRENVSDRFFRQFSKAVQKVTRELESQKIATADARSWALLFLSRVLFLFFIQEKGWLDGDHNFLIGRSLTRSSHSIYRRFLQPLFFECLNKRPSQRSVSARRLGQIPYLNGGLFRRSPLEERTPELTIPDELVREVLTDVFARFPFTIREDDETIVAIDPEMLGHVFESLMEETERARTGSFYTPKPIVDQLVGRALRFRLGSEIDHPELMGESERSALLERLRDLAVLDPACGSGAFLLAAMKEIERLRIACGDEASPEKLRQQIVEQNLYGVDLKQEAVQLCELRLWLAIVASRPAGVETIPSIEPLPNLDRNILQGNALLDPISFAAGHRREAYRQWSAAVRERSSLVKSYRHAFGDRRRVLSAELRNSDLRLGGAMVETALEMETSAYEELTSQQTLFETARRPAIEARMLARIGDLGDELARLRRGEVGFFSFDLHFSQVMGRGGFDLVFGNPPWVRGAQLPPDLRELLRQRYRWPHPAEGSPQRGIPQFELSVLFLERSMQVAHPSGVVSMLVPGKLLNAYYAARCRDELASRHTLLAIDDWTRERGLFRADTFPIGLTFTPERGESSVEIVRDGERWESEPSFLRISEAAPGWTLLPESVVRPLRRVWQRHRSLAEVLDRHPVMGVKTGANTVYFLEETDLDASGLMTIEGIRIPWTALTRCVRGRDVRRWKSSSSTWMLWPEERKPSLWRALYAAAHDLHPEDLRLAYVRPEHLGWNVAWKDVATRVEAVVLPSSVEILGHEVPLIPNQTLYCLDATSADESYFLSAIMNSTVFSGLACTTAEAAKDGHYRFFGQTIGRLPWPETCPSDPAGRRLIRLARAAHHGADVQEELDRLVGEIYGFDGDVLAALVRWL